MASDSHTDADDVPEYEVRQEQELLTDLDPELQEVVLALGSAGSEAAATPVDVIAVLRDPNGEVPEGLNIVGPQTSNIVTGTVEAGRIESVRRHPNVFSLKGARRVYHTLDKSVPEIRASRAHVQDAVPGKDLAGDGVIVGVVDHGCDFLHPNFQKGDGTTRLLYLWDQHGTRGGAPPDFPYGTEYDGPEINLAIAQSTPEQPTYQLGGYEPTSGAHGTHVMDIAAGGGTNSNPPGVAPRADLIFVDVADDDVSISSPFGNSRHLLDAVRYIFKRADELGKPAVVNISLNSDAGPHDGSTPFERELDHLLETPGRAVVIAAGNSWGRNHHASLTLRPGIEQMMFWEIPFGDTTENKVELWYGGAHEVEVHLVSPRGHSLGPFQLGTTNTIDHRGITAGRIYHRQRDPNNGDNQLLLLFSPLMEAGLWLIAFRPLTSATFKIHGWIGNDGARPSSFRKLVLPRDNAYTVGAIACGHSPIVVGAYHSRADQSLLADTSEGPTRDSKQKPELSAPGGTEPSTGISAAFARTNISTHLAEGGTSSAAPHVTGLVALLMQNARRLLTTAETRALVLRHARLNPPSDGGAWHPRYGLGRADASASLMAQAQFIPLEPLAFIEVTRLVASVSVSSSTTVGHASFEVTTVAAVAAVTEVGGDAAEENRP